MRKREYSLDVIKIVATLCIIFHHYQIYTRTHFDSGVNFNGGIFNFGYLVELFFVLSGYFTFKYISEIDNGLPFKEFFVQKYLRFTVPLSISCLAFSLLAILYNALYGELFFNHGVTIWGLIVSSLGMSAGWGLGSYNINGVIWYISVLLICYMVFYFTTWISTRLKINNIWGYLLLIILGIGIKTYEVNFSFINQFTARGYTAFFTGILLAQLLCKYQLRAKGYAISAFILIVIPLLLYQFKSSYMSVGVDYIFTFLFYPALIIIFKSNMVNKLTNFVWIGKLGKISFEAYLWHFVVILGFHDVIGLLNLKIEFANRTLMGLVAISSYIIGTIVFYLVEIPSERYIKRKLGGGKASKK